MEEDYPFDKLSGQGNYIIDHSIVALDNTFFIFGGDAGNIHIKVPGLVRVSLPIPPI